MFLVFSQFKTKSNVAGPSHIDVTLNELVDVAAEEVISVSHLPYGDSLFRFLPNQSYCSLQPFGITDKSHTLKCITMAFLLLL